MSLDGFLTFLTLIIAAYGVASSPTRLRLRLHLFGVTVISFIGFVLVIYYEMLVSEPAGIICPSWVGRQCRFLNLSRTFPTGPQIAFGVVIIWWLAAWFLLSRTSISPRAFPNLRRLVDELHYEHRIAELIQVVEPNLSLLEAAASRKLPGAKVYDTLRRWRRDETPREIMARLTTDAHEFEAPSRHQRALSWLKHCVGTAGRALPSGRSSEEAAREILRVLLLSRKIVEFIALYRAAFGVKLLTLHRIQEVFEFSDEYLTTLISTPHSTLYLEVKNNQNYSHGNNFFFPTENKLLNFLFENAKQAERLGVWEPLGDWILSKLRSDLHPDYTESLNLSAESFDRDPWEDPTFVVVKFFELMVSAALYQDISWHMWLYYFDHIVRRLTELYSDRGDGVDATDEFPTRSAYIIYTMFRIVRDWITAVTDLPDTSSQLMMKDERVVHENGNIPKSAILALGTCLKTLLLAPNVGDRFKRTIVSLVARAVDELPRNGARSAFRRSL